MRPVPPLPSEVKVHNFHHSLQTSSLLDRISQSRSRSLTWSPQICPTKAYSNDNNDEGLHADDVLITKWFLECTTLELLDCESARNHMLRVAREAEADIKNGIHRVPPQISWPQPPPRPRSELEARIEKWRQPRLRMMDRLIAQWTIAKTNHPRHGGTEAAPVTRKCS